MPGDEREDGAWISARPLPPGCASCWMQPRSNSTRFPMRLPADRSDPADGHAKQILGHLIDSAANNHQRFIRLQLTPELHFPSYQQSDWVSRNQYGERPWAELVSLWTALNRHLAHVIEHIAPETLVNVWDTGSNRYTLGFIVDDYLVHLRHHLEQIMAAG